MYISGDYKLSYFGRLSLIVLSIEISLMMFKY